MGIGFSSSYASCDACRISTTGVDFTTSASSIVQVDMSDILARSCGQGPQLTMAAAPSQKRHGVRDPSLSPLPPHTGPASLPTLLTRASRKPSENTASDVSACVKDAGSDLKSASDFNDGCLVSPACARPPEAWQPPASKPCAFDWRVCSPQQSEMSMMRLPALPQCIADLTLDAGAAKKTGALVSEGLRVETMVKPISPLGTAQRENEPAQARSKKDVHELILACSPAFEDHREMISGSWDSGEFWPFDGVWKHASNSDGPSIEVIFEGELFWNDHNVSMLVPTSATDFLIELHGEVFQARLSSSGAQLLWDDGDVWVRVPNVSRQEVQHAIQLRAFPTAIPEVDEAESMTVATSLAVATPKVAEVVDVQDTTLPWRTVVCSSPMKPQKTVLRAEPPEAMPKRCCFWRSRET